MGIIFKQRVVDPVATPVAGPVAGVDDSTEPLKATMVQATPTPVKGKVVLKIGTPKGATIPDDEPMTERQQNKLIDAGLMDKTEKKYAHIAIGQRVKITDSLPPWVKHYATGDIGVVRLISNTLDPLGEDHPGHLLHIIDITEPVDQCRKGQRAALFRKEFVPVETT